MGLRVNSVLTRNGCIKCYTLLFKEIILQHLDAFQTEIKGSLMKLCAFKASRGHSSKVVKLPILSPGAENMEHTMNCIFAVQLRLKFGFQATWASQALMILSLSVKSVS